MTYYDSISSGYDELHSEEQNKKLDFILNHFPANFEPKQTDSLLDVGCGSGISTAFWNCKTTGIDPSKNLIALAKKKYPDCEFIVAPAEHIPFKDKEFDFIVSLTAIQNFDNIEAGLREIRRVSKPGAKFVLTFLKRSEKSKSIEERVKRLFTIAARLEEDKDVIFFLYL
jgi:ubiquinone/menaquinone biosynthesis C-methylase UbiE